LRDQLRSGLHFTGAPVTLFDWLITVINARALFGATLGTSLLDIRLIAATFGLLSMFALVWFGIEIGRPRLGLLAACIYGVMPWAIYYNRVAIPASEYAFLTLVGVCFLIRAVKRHRWRCVYWGMIPLVLAIYLYPPALITSPGIAIIVFLVYRLEISRRGVFHIVTAGLLACALLSYYAVVQFVAPEGVSIGARAVISGQELWQHHLSVGTMVSRFVFNWASYLNPSFLFVHGDPNKRQSIQIMGEVGYVIGALGVLGVVEALRTWNRDTKCVLALLCFYPVADALTYYNAPANSDVGELGCVVWALLAAFGIYAVTFRGVRIRWWRSRSFLINGVAVLLLCTGLLACQVGVFSWYYLSRYSSVAASSFEVGYPTIVKVLEQHDARDAPVVMQGSFDENVMLDYVDQDHPKVLGLYFTCSALSSIVARYTPPGWVIVIRESSAYNDYRGCVAGYQIIRLDEEALTGAGRRFVVWADFSNGSGAPYRTAVLWLSPSRRTG
jgi:hypothetical protein